MGAGGQLDFVSAAATVPVSLSRMKMIHYYVNDNGLLMRRVFGVRNAPFNESMIAEHVVSLQFRYFLNMRDANGNVMQPLEPAHHLAATGGNAPGRNNSHRGNGARIAKWPTTADVDDHEHQRSQHAVSPEPAAHRRRLNPLTHNNPKHCPCHPKAPHSMKRAPAARASSERGAALVTSILILGMLSAVALTVLAVVTKESQIAGKRSQEDADVLRGSSRH